MKECMSCIYYIPLGISALDCSIASLDSSFFLAVEPFLVFFDVFTFSTSSCICSISESIVKVGLI